MDNVTHTLFGATLARIPLARAGRGTTAALLLASNAPDIDIVTAAGGALGYLEWHRGPTHGAPGIIGLGVVTAAIVWATCRLFGRDPAVEPVRFRRLVPVSIAGVLFHVLMDLPTSYGTRLLSPFDWHWYAIDLMPIIDIYLLAILAACLWFGSARGMAARRNAVLALVLMMLNYGLRLAAHREALASAPRIFGPALPPRCDAAVGQQFVDRWPVHGPLSARDAQGRCLLEIVALPSFVSPFQWRLMAHLSNAYETRVIDLVALRLREPPGDAEAPWRLVQRVPNRWTEPALRAAQSRTAQVFLGFSRLPVVRSRAEADGSTTVTWTDIRFNPGPPRSRVDRERNGFFSATVRVGPEGQILQERLGP